MLWSRFVQDSEPHSARILFREPLVAAPHSPIPPGEGRPAVWRFQPLRQLQRSQELYQETAIGKALPPPMPFLLILCGHDVSKGMISANLDGHAVESHQKTTQGTDFYLEHPKNSYSESYRRRHPPSPVVEAT